MRRVVTERHYYGCTLDDVKEAIANGALPRASAQIVDGMAKVVVSDFLGAVHYDADGEKVEHTWHFDWSNPTNQEIKDYLNEDYEGGFYV
jgi:hypothetical protein